MQGLLDAEAGTAAGSQPTVSTWQGILRKTSMLLPFVWPRGSIPLQLCVIACIGLLVAGRVANLYIPLYYKKISKSIANLSININIFSTSCLQKT